MDDNLSAGKRAAIAWAKANHLEWRISGWASIEVHFPNDNYAGYDPKGKWGTQPHYRSIYDEENGCCEFTPPSAEYILTLVR